MSSGLMPSLGTLVVCLFIVLLPILHSAVAEYTWNGTEWVWNEDVSRTAVSTVAATLLLLPLLLKLLKFLLMLLLLLSILPLLLLL